MSGRLLRVHEITEQYGASEFDVRAWISTGHRGDKLPATRLPSGDYRVRQRDLDEFERLCAAPR